MNGTLGKVTWVPRAPRAGEAAGRAGLGGGPDYHRPCRHPGIENGENQALPGSTRDAL